MLAHSFTNEEQQQQKTLKKRGEGGELLCVYYVCSFSHPMIGPVIAGIDM